jgi:hypothetical protein
MQNRMKWIIAITATITVMATFSISANHNSVHAQGAASAFQGAPHCTMGKASGT